MKKKQFKFTEYAASRESRTSSSSFNPFSVRESIKAYILYKLNTEMVRTLNCHLLTSHLTPRLYWSYLSAFCLPGCRSLASRGHQGTYPSARCKYGWYSICLITDRPYRWRFSGFLELKADMVAHPD